MHELPERLLVRAERDVVHSVGGVEEAAAAAWAREVAVLPDAPSLLRVDDDNAVVVVVVDGDVPVRKHDRERRVVECAPARRRPVPPEGLAMSVEDDDGPRTRVVREENPSAGKWLRVRRIRGRRLKRRAEPPRATEAVDPGAVDL